MTKARGLLAKPRLRLVASFSVLALCATTPHTATASPCISQGYLHNFLANYQNKTTGAVGSPEAPYAQDYIEDALVLRNTNIQISPTQSVLDSVDPRLVAAISGAESHFGTDRPETTCESRLNDWDWGGGPPNCYTYTNYADGISAVMTGLTQTYMAKLRLLTIPTIAGRYCNNQCGAPATGCTAPNAWICNVTFYYTHIGTPGDASGDAEGLMFGAPDALGQCCEGDCSGSGSVNVNDIVAEVNFILDPFDYPNPGALCPAAFEEGQTLPINVFDLEAAIHDALYGCQQ